MNFMSLFYAGNIPCKFVHLLQNHLYREVGMLTPLRFPIGLVRPLVADMCNFRLIRNIEAFAISHSQQYRTDICGRILLKHSFAKVQLRYLSFKICLETIGATVLKLRSFNRFSAGTINCL